MVSLLFFHRCVIISPLPFRVSPIAHLRKLDEFMSFSVPIWDEDQFYCFQLETGQGAGHPVSLDIRFALIEVGKRTWSSLLLFLYLQLSNLPWFPVSIFLDFSKFSIRDLLVYSCGIG